MSTSPTDRTLDPDINRNGANVPGKKRWSQDATDYPRRRATIACEICRSRKSRCDGTKPKCRLCTELGAQCVYREPGIKLDAGDKLILEHLDRIEGLIQASMASLNPRPPGVYGFSPTASSVTNEETTIGRASGSTQALPLSNGLGTWPQAMSAKRCSAGSRRRPRRPRPRPARPP